MAKIMLPYLYKTRAKGRDYYYYRRNGERIRLPDDPSSAEFMIAYQRIHASFETGATPTAETGSIAALIEAFRKSTEYNGLKPRVRELYAPALDAIKIKLGQFPAHKMTRRVALEWRDDMAATPGKANNVMSVLKRLYSFGLERGIVKLNPIIGLKRLKTGEWRPWKAAEAQTFREHAPMHMRLALDLGLYTGQRLSDIIDMRWNHIEEGGIMVKQQKTGERVWIPIHKRFARDD
jgi:integrase